MWLPPNSFSKKSKVKKVLYNTLKNLAENNLASSVPQTLVGKINPVVVNSSTFIAKSCSSEQGFPGLEQTQWCLPALASNHKKWIPGLLFCLSSKIKFPRLGEEWRGAPFLLLLHLAAKLLSDKLQKNWKCAMDKMYPSFWKSGDITSYLKGYFKQMIQSASRESCKN